MVMAPGTNNLIGQVTMALNAGVPTSLSFPLNARSETITPRHARIQVEGNAVRWGLNPNAASGQYVSAVPPNNLVLFEDPASDYTGILRQVQFVALGGNATLQINYMS